MIISKRFDLISTLSSVHPTFTFKEKAEEKYSFRYYRKVWGFPEDKKKRIKTNLEKMLPTMRKNILLWFVQENRHLGEKKCYTKEQIPAIVRRSRCPQYQI